MSERHSHGQELAGEHPLTDIGQLVLFVVFLVTWVTDTFVFRCSVFMAASVPAVLRLSLGTAHQEGESLPSQPLHQKPAQ